MGRSIFSKNITANDLLGIIGIAIFCIIVAAYNIYLAVDEINFVNEYYGEDGEESISEFIDMLNSDDPEMRIAAEQYLYEIGTSRQEFEDTLALMDFRATLDKVDIIIYGAMAVFAVLMMLRIKISYLLETIAYIVATITYIIYTVNSVINFSIISNLADSIEGSIFVIILRIAIIKLLIMLTISAHQQNNAPVGTPYVAPVGDIPLTPTERSTPSIDPVTGHVASTVPSMLQKNPQPSMTHTASTMQQAVPIPPEEAGQDWQCRGCGYTNQAKNKVCAFCGSDRTK